MPPSDKEQLKKAIQAVIAAMMERKLRRIFEEDPFDAEEHRLTKPLYAALVPMEIFKGSHFERRFVTSFGSVWEDLALVAAKSALGFSEKGYKITGVVKQERLRRIAEILNRLEFASKGKARARPDWDTELSYILAGGGPDVAVSVICDVFAKNTTTNERFAFEVKAPLPNSDQTKVSKEKMLKLYAMEPCQIDGAYYALPYKPYGKREDYAWSFPARWFNMRKDAVVLIGDDFWEKIGGPGTYKTFVDAVNEMGEMYRDRIYREYLGIEPPASAASQQL